MRALSLLCMLFVVGCGAWNPKLIECESGEKWSKREKQCVPREGFVDAGMEDAATAEPDGPECASQDADCDSCVESTWYADLDNDGLGDPADVAKACKQPEGYVANADDLDPLCGREAPSADCAVNAVRCAGSGNREQCSEDTSYPGCTDWTAFTSCDESAPVCDDGACNSCSTNDDCAGFDDNQVCDRGTGACVQCTGADSHACGGFVCESKARTCATGVLPASAEFCESCVSDAQCGKGGRLASCLPTGFNGEDLGYFCQPRIADGETCIDNHRPYVAAAVDSKQEALVSIDGSSAASCKLALTTCAALSDFRNKSCSGPSDNDACGVVGLDDGMCVAVPAQSSHRCSIPCLGNDDCKTGSTCTDAGACSL